MSSVIRHILIAIDGSPLSTKAVRYGVGLARSLGAKVTGVHVIPVFHRFTYRAQMLLTYHTALSDDSEAGYEAATAKCAQKILGTIARAAHTAKVLCGVVALRSDQPYQAIIDAAQSKRCDLIVIASHGHRGVNAVILGSEAQKVLTHCAIPVLVCR